MGIESINVKKRIPPRVPTVKTRMLYVAIDKKLKEGIDNASKTLGIETSEFVRRVMRKFLEDESICTTTEEK